MIVSHFYFYFLNLDDYNEKGTALGNLFFSTWGGFILSVMILSDCFRGAVVLAAQGAVTSEIELQEDNDI